MSAKIVTVSPSLIWHPNELQRLWFFPKGSRFLRYPHYHAIFPGGFRQNLPLWPMFVVILDGKLSIKNFDGKTVRRIDVRDQVWYHRGTNQTAQMIYVQMLARI